MRLLFGSICLLAFLLVALPAPTEAEQHNDNGCIFGFFRCGVTEGLQTVEEEELGTFLNRTKVIDAAQRTDDRDNIFGGGSVPSVGIGGGIAGYIIATGYFINFVIIPLLFGIALLVFLFNIFRYFIIQSAAGKAEAKTAALYGIAAFVFLVSIWGIVNLFVYGLDFDRETALCPDWLGTWCGTQGFSSFTRPGVTTGIGGGGGGRDSGGFGGAVGVDPADSGSSGIPAEHSALAELLFGQFQDGATFSFQSGPPQAQTNTLALSPAASCSDGFAALKLAAGVEPRQAAFAIYSDSNGNSRWQNITDVHSPTGIGYDADVLNDLIAAGGHNITIAHTHPKKPPQDAGLSMDGHGPSAADFFILCDGTANDATYVTVDWQNTWLTTQPNGACPRRSLQDDDLVVVEALSAVAMVTPGGRNEEWRKMLISPITPSRAERMLSDFASTNFDGMSTGDILALANEYEQRAQVNVRLESVSNICTL